MMSGPWSVHRLALGQSRAGLDKTPEAASMQNILRPGQPRPIFSWLSNAKMKCKAFTLFLAWGLQSLAFVRWALRSQALTFEYQDSLISCCVTASPAVPPSARTATQLERYWGFTWGET